MRGWEGGGVGALPGRAGNTITIKSEMEEGLSCPFWIFILSGGCGGNSAIPECINLWLGEGVQRDGYLGGLQLDGRDGGTPANNWGEWRNEGPQDGSLCRGRDGNERFIWVAKPEIWVVIEKELCNKGEEPTEGKWEERAGGRWEWSDWAEEGIRIWRQRHHLRISVGEGGVCKVLCFVLVACSN